MAVRHQRRVGTAPDPKRAARRAFGHYGRYYAEVFWMRPRRRADVLRRSTIENIEYLHEAVASDQGLVLALPHVGNWEAAGLRGAAEGARVLAVAEELGNERVVQWFVDMRAMMDIDIVIARKGARVTGQLLSRLKDGGTIALLCDRNIAGKGVEVEFFGERTLLPAGPVAMAMRTGSRLLPVGTYFKEGAGHRYRLWPPMEFHDDGDAEAAVAAGTQRLAAVLEEIIGADSEQWHNLQPSWPSDRAPA